MIQVETYEIEPEATEQQEAEAVALAKELGLKGQAKLSGDGCDIRVPYREVTEEEWTIITTLFTSSKVVEEFDRGPIPLRVLQVLEHAKSLDFFQSFKIYYPRTASETDPVLIARTKGYDGERYLLARWGDELVPWGELRKKAAKRIHETFLASAKKAKAELDGWLRLLEEIKPGEESLELSAPYISLG